jgi:hypothetical protein
MTTEKNNLKQPKIKESFQNSTRQNQGEVLFEEQDDGEFNFTEITGAEN